MNKPCLSDEILIDKVLHKLSEEREQTVLEHLPHCPSCQRRLKEWQMLLHEKKPRFVPWRYTAPKLKKRLRNYLFSAPHKRVFSGKPAFLLMAVTLLFCATLFFGLWSAPGPAPDEGTATADSHLTYASHFLMDPQTAHYRIEQTVLLPVDEERLPMSRIDGNLWVDHTGRQIFLALEGLHHLPEKDYQVWVITEQVANNAGLVKLMDSNAFLYWNSQEPTEIEMIRISIEPKGGSLYPTGPEAFTIFLKR